MKLRKGLSVIGGFISRLFFQVLPFRFYNDLMELNGYGLLRQHYAIEVLGEIECLLSRKEYMEISEELATSESQIIELDAQMLNKYFSILDLYAEMLRKKVVIDMQDFSMPNKHLDCLRKHKDICAYLHENPTVFEHLSWLLEKSR